MSELSNELLLKQRGRLGAMLIEMMSAAGTGRQESAKKKANLLLNDIMLPMSEANESLVYLNALAQAQYMCEEIATALGLDVQTPAETVQSVRQAATILREHKPATMTTYDLFSGKEE